MKIEIHGEDAQQAITALLEIKEISELIDKNDPSVVKIEKEKDISSLIKVIFLNIKPILEAMGHVDATLGLAEKIFKWTNKFINTQKKIDKIVFICGDKRLVILNIDRNVALEQIKEFIETC